MKENQECEIIKDLLPNYIEGLTSEETNTFIKEHLEECKNCKKIYESMSEDLNIKEDSNDRRKIKALKKVHKKIRILQAIIFSVIAIYIFIYVKNVIILNRIIDLGKSNNFNNYYQKSVTTTQKYSAKTEYYQSSENFLYITTCINSDNTIDKIIKGKLYGQNFYYYEENGIDKSSDYSPSIEANLQWRFVNKPIGLALIPGVVRNATLDKRECYLVELENNMFFIDKETGMEVKKIYSSDNKVYDDEYSFGTVTNEQIENMIKQYKDNSLLRYM